MESFLSSVRSHSGAGNFNELVEFLSKHVDTLHRHNTDTVLNTALETLDIQQHSLGVLTVLRARLLQNPISEWDELFNRIAIFILDCNGEQIRHWSSKFADLCHLFTDQLISRHTPIVGIPALLKAVQKLQLSESSLTSVHADVCRLCLAAKCFAPAVNILNVDVTDISAEAAEEPKYILLYFYYGGMIFTALKLFDKALYYFEACLTVPTFAVSHIMMEAYNKYLLVSLIINGDKPKESSALPKYTSPVVNKYIRPLSSAYHDLVTGFYSNQTSELDNVINRNSSVYDNDGNMGLVRQVSIAQTRANIKRLTKTFVTLSLADVASRIGLASTDQAERHIVAMVQEGSIHARISQKDGMVQFDSSQERFNSVRMLSELEDRVTSCMGLNAQVSQMEEDIVLSASYIKKSNSTSVAAAAAAAASASLPPGRSPLDLDADLDFSGSGGGGGTSSGPSLPRSASNSAAISSSGGPAAASAPGGGASQASSSSANSNHVAPSASSASGNPSSSNNGPANINH